MKKQEAEILAFPKHKIVRMVPDESVAKIKAKNLKQNADELIDMLCNDLVYGFSTDFDIDVQTKDFQKDFSFTMEVMRATIYRTMGLDHPLHAHIDEVVKVASSIQELEGIIEEMESKIEFEPEEGVFDDDEEEEK